MSKAEYLTSRGWDFVGMDGEMKMWKSRRVEFCGKILPQGFAINLQRKADGVDLVDGKNLTNEEIGIMAGLWKKKVSVQ